MNRSEAGKLGYQKSRLLLEEYNRQKTATAIAKYIADPKICIGCSLPIPYESRQNDFCSHSCSASTNNRKRKPRGPSHECANCGVYVRGVKFCTECRPKCSKRRLFTLEEATRDSTRRKVLIREHGLKCWTCGLSEWIGQSIPIELDHIDGNHKNNDRSNLRLLCPNCHAQTPTYKGKNMGHGRTYRRSKPESPLSESDGSFKNTKLECSQRQVGVK